jgi:hypothetical protein
LKIAEVVTDGKKPEHILISSWIDPCRPGLFTSMRINGSKRRIFVAGFIRLEAIAAVIAVVVFRIGQPIAVIVDAPVATVLGNTGVGVRIRIVSIQVWITTGCRRRISIPVPIQIRTGRPRLLPREENAG